jgi:hypothetical protein
MYIPHLLHAYIYTPKHYVCIKIILSVILYGSETWSHNFRDDMIYKCLKVKCPGEYFDLRRKRQLSNLENYTTRNFLIYSRYIVLLGQLNTGGYDGPVMWLGWGDKEYTQNFGEEIT